MKQDKKFINQHEFEHVNQTYKGFSYDSKLEARYAAKLDRDIKEGKIDLWERQVKVELFGENGSRVADYKIDFVVYHKNGLTEYVEVKGFESADWRLKWNLLEDKLGKRADIKLSIIR